MDIDLVIIDLVIIDLDIIDLVILVNDIAISIDIIKLKLILHVIRISETNIITLNKNATAILGVMENIIPNRHMEHYVVTMRIRTNIKNIYYVLQPLPLVLQHLLVQQILTPVSYTHLMKPP